MIVESAPPDPVRRPPACPSLADVRSDMATLFGTHEASDAPPPRTIEIAVNGSAAPFGPATRRRRIAGPLLAAATAGLLIGVAGVGGLRFADLGNGTPVSPPRAPATSVAENPFEQSPPPAAPATPPVTAVTAPRPSTSEVRKPAHTERLASANIPKITRVTKVAASPRHAAGKKSRTAGKAAKTVSTSAGCGGDRLEQAWCMRPDILAADRRLRGAYAEAIHQGVERRYLVEHQRRWTRLRKLAARDPKGVLEGYGELAGDLERLSTYGRAADRVQ